MGSPLTELSKIMTRLTVSAVNFITRGSGRRNPGNSMATSTISEAAYGSDPAVTANIEAGLQPILSRDLPALIPTLRIGDRFHGTTFRYTIIGFDSAYNTCLCLVEGTALDWKTSISHSDFIHSTLERCLGGV